MIFLYDFFDKIIYVKQRFQFVFMSKKSFAHANYCIQKHTSPTSLILDFSRLFSKT